MKKKIEYKNMLDNKHSFTITTKTILIMFIVNIILMIIISIFAFNVGIDYTLSEAVENNCGKYIVVDKTLGTTKFIWKTESEESDVN